MPKLKHKVKAEKMEAGIEMAPYMPSVNFAISKEQLQALEVGKKVTVQITGKVKRLSTDENSRGNDNYDLSMELAEIIIDSGANEFTDLAEED